jgi:hypothetical protein
VSRALFQLEKQLPAPLSLAQAMVIIKDQVAIKRMTTAGSSLGSYTSIANIAQRNTPANSFVNWALSAIK